MDSDTSNKPAVPLVAPPPDRKPPQKAPPNRLLRWSARIASLASLAVLTVFLIGEGFDPAALKAREWALQLFFPFGVMFGSILGWRCERLGGGIAVFSLVAFYIVHLVQAGSLPSGWAFAALAALGPLFLVSATANEPLSE